VPTSADRVLITSGASEGIDLALSALANPDDDVLVPVPTYPLYTAVLAKLGVRARPYRCDPERGWVPDLQQIRDLAGPRTRALVLINPNNPSGAIYPEPLLRGLIELAEERGLCILADEVYAELAYDGPVPPLASLAPDAPVLSFGSLSKAFLAPGWRAGWVAVGRSSRLDGVLQAMLKLADGRLCSPVPAQHAIAPALGGAREHQVSLRAALAERADVVVQKMNGPTVRCVAPRAAFYAMPQVQLPAGKTDEQFVLGLLQATGILCVHGSGFGTPAPAGFFRIVFLPAVAELSGMLDELLAFADRFRASR
jgi:alanine-synthesizing transaminase